LFRLGFIDCKQFLCEVMVDIRRPVHACCDLMHGFGWPKWMTGARPNGSVYCPAGQEHVLQQEDGKARFAKFVTDISVPSPCAQLTMKRSACATTSPSSKPCDQTL
jgi:hypothetical protein